MISWKCECGRESIHVDTEELANELKAKNAVCGVCLVQEKYKWIIIECETIYGKETHNHLVPKELHSEEEIIDYIKYRMIGGQWYWAVNNIRVVNKHSN